MTQTNGNPHSVPTSTAGSSTTDSRARRVAFVTGAGSGIGAAMCAHLATSGVGIAAADRDEAGLARLRDTIDAIAPGAPFMSAIVDVRDEASQQRFVAAAEETLGPITDVVPCAGLARSAPAERMTLDEWDMVLDVNLRGTFLTCKSAAAVMLPRGRGNIVCLASITGRGGQPGRANYAASKWGVIGLMKSLATEWGHRGIRVNAVAPNGVDTPMLTAGVPADFLQGVMLDRTPLGRFARVDEVVQTIDFLLSDAASYITGSVIDVDGGLTAGYLTHRQGRDYAKHTL